MLPFGLSDKSGPEINLPLRSVALWNSEARFWPNVVVKYHFETAEESGAQMNDALILYECLYAAACQINPGDYNMVTEF